MAVGLLRVVVLATGLMLAGVASAGAAVSTGNLLQNPGAETGPCASEAAPAVPIPGWTVPANFTVLTFASNPMDNGEGNCYFMGGVSEASSASQDIDVSGFAGEIDAGGLPVTLKARLGGYLAQEDNMVVRARFYDAANNLISGVQIGPVTATDRQFVSILLPRSATGAVPVGTRSITVSMVAVHFEGTDNDGAADNVSLRLGTPRPPVVTITGTPPKVTAARKARFTFTGEAGGTFECSIDNRSFNPCSSGDTFGPLAPGDHRFRVEETNDGLRGPPAGYTWTVALPRACVLRTARARVVVFERKNKVRLVINYTSYKPAKVTASYRVAGSKGKLALGKATRRFTKNGIFRLARKLSVANTAKVRAAKIFRVRFRIPGTPTGCMRFYSKRLTIPKKKVAHQTVWFQSDSKFAPGF